MNRKVIFFINCIILTIILGCATVTPLKSYKKSNSFYIENINKDGLVAGIDNIVINNITFFKIKYEILGIKNLDSQPKTLDSGTVSIRENKNIKMKSFFSDSTESLENYKYICVRFPEGTLKKCSAYSKNDDLNIDIEQYGIEPNKTSNQIDEELFEELEKTFNQ